MRKLVALIMVCAPLHASAEVMDYTKCQVNSGKTLADVQAWARDWRALAKKKGVEYQLRILVPHADPQMHAGGLLHRRPRRRAVTPSRGTGGTRRRRRGLNKQLNAAATCDAGAIYRSTDDPHATALHVLTGTGTAP